MEDEWRKVELWRKLGTSFCIEVSRHAVEADKFEGEHRWCVYAYIYPAHPNFGGFDEANGICQSAASELPLHGGPSFLKMHRNKNGEVTSIQVGCDYNHVGDVEFSYCETKEDAASVFRDADVLFKWLGEKSQ